MINKLNKLNKGVKIVSQVVICLSGLVAFITQGIQGFTGRWNEDFTYELGLLLFYFMVARYPHKIISLIDIILSKFNLKTSKAMSKKDEPIEDQDLNVGGDGTTEEDTDV